jgi:hypothetical protein
MKNRNLNNYQYDYANNVVKIFGFKNLADYDNRICITELKKNQNEICQQINQNMDTFKKLFVLKKFDLARLDYQLKTFNHAFTFIKKLFDYRYK